MSPHVHKFGEEILVFLLCVSFIGIFLPMLPVWVILVVGLVLFLILKYLLEKQTATSPPGETDNQSQDKD